MNLKHWVLGALAVLLIAVAAFSPKVKADQVTLTTKQCFQLGTVSTKVVTEFQKGKDYMQMLRIMKSTPIDREVRKVINDVVFSLYFEGTDDMRDTIRAANPKEVGDFMAQQCLGYGGRIEYQKRTSV